MQGQITLSKKEKRFQFLYLILMLLAAMLFLGIIFLNGFESPFNSSDVLTLKRLEQKSKFDTEQKNIQAIVDSTFMKISSLDAENSEAMKIHDIEKNTDFILSTKKRFPTPDERIEGYPLIGDFYIMYMEDKTTVKNMTEDVKRLEVTLKNCETGYKTNEQRLFEKNIALKSR
nr:type VI secretion system TssO [uncultured Chryseobacterium sp.]